MLIVECCFGAGAVASEVGDGIASLASFEGFLTGLTFRGRRQVKPSYASLCFYRWQWEQKPPFCDWAVMGGVAFDLSGTANFGGGGSL
jgi:hypothetical protein